MENTRFFNNDFLCNVAELSDKLLTIEDFSELTNKTIECIKRTINPVYISFLLFEGVSYRLLIDRYDGHSFKRTAKPVTKDCENVALSMAKGGKILACPDKDSFRFLVLFDHDQNEQCEIRLPFFVNKKYTGIISLGKQQSDMEYSVEVIDFLQVLTNTVAMACHNISLKTENDHDVNNNEVKNTDQKEKELDHQSSIGNKGQGTYSEILGNSPGIVKIREMIERVADQEVPVLISGESGTGKELVAQAIHQKSTRSTRPLVAMNCAAMPDNLVESELFGHEKGAFTGAFTQKHGKFEYAHQSSLFLDEIGDMNLSTQAKLLRVLQDGQFQRVGGNKSLYSDVRLVAATNKDLLEEIKKGHFRQDLYYRINVVQIKIPPLRKRRNDIVLLAEIFLDYYKKHYNKTISGFDYEVLEWMIKYEFPGNVRELKNIIERSVIMGKKSTISMDLLPGVDLIGSGPASTNPIKSLDEIEKEHITAVIKHVGYNKSAAARMLGIARKTLREKLQKYSITF